MSVHRQHYPCADLRAQLRNAARRTSAARIALALAYCAAFAVLLLEVAR